MDFPARSLKNGSTIIATRSAVINEIKAIKLDSVKN